MSTFPHLTTKFNFLSRSAFFEMNFKIFFNELQSQFYVIFLWNRNGTDGKSLFVVFIAGKLPRQKSSNFGIFFHQLSSDVFRFEVFKNCESNRTWKFSRVICVGNQLKNCREIKCQRLFEDWIFHCAWEFA